MDSVPTEVNTDSLATFLTIGRKEGEDIVPNRHFEEKNLVITRFANCLVEHIQSAANKLGAHSEINAEELLWERTQHRNAINVPSTFTMRADDEWVSLTLSRREDIESIPALTLGSVRGNATRNELQTYVHRVSANEFRDQAILLGLSCAVLREVTTISPHAVTQFARVSPPPLHGLRVLDLSALWAGPLCARILRQCGATVTVIESLTRQDSHRLSIPTFFEALRRDQTIEQYDVTDPQFASMLSARIAEADVVLTSSRPRALSQWGVDPDTIMQSQSSDQTGPHCWISITGFGPDQSNRIGYGDDAAFAAGLVSGTDAKPNYLGDAVADPLSGLAAAAVVLTSLRRGQRVHANIALADVAATALAMFGDTDPLRSSP